ncbi:MAG TPA: Gfo/Idh/MocA family oxidoreductase [Acidobacteriota bacterium]|nr:Gfo/Idh/MocA family oxidoreductase [Acidobacteriota bacterium]HNT17621.1 Gfo/Idh/MocA family oxidoreductase [Acidobacteriota bacterium]
MVDSQPVKVAVIGAGNIAREHIRAFSDISGVAVSGIFSRTRSKAENLAAEMGIAKVCGSIEELKAVSQAQIVVSAVDVISMPKVIMECLDHDWLLFVEKPPSLYLEEASVIREAAIAKGKDIRIAMNRSFYSTTRMVLSEIGRVDGRRIIMVEDQQDPEMFVKLGRPAEIADRLMYGNSIHLVDYFRIFARGVVANVNAKQENIGSRPEMVHARIEYDTGDLGIYNAFWNQPGPWSVTVHVPDVRFEMRPLEECRRQERGKKPEQMEADLWDRNFKPGFRAQAEEMVKVVREGKGNVPVIDDAIKTMKLIRDIYGK